MKDSAGTCRITPACAGTTVREQKVPQRTTDHPRMCGDHDMDDMTSAMKLGSLPHVRGPPRYPEGERDRAGITPACAGTTLLSRSYAHLSWDHPRMCGDHLLLFLLVRVLRGSPPHVRGPLRDHIITSVSPRITPACAGTTVAEVEYVIAVRDHPRMCGDHGHRAYG